MPSLCTVDSIRVGPKEMFSNAGNVPLAFFQTTAVDSMLRGFTAQIGMDVVFTVANASPAVPETITGVIVGEAMDD